jgi:hypothetical protein
MRRGNGDQARRLLSGKDLALVCAARRCSTSAGRRGGDVARVVLVLGIQMVMLGILGEYLWRALDEGRSRPRYVVERRTDDQ